MSIYSQKYIDQLISIALPNKYTFWYIGLCNSASLRGTNRKQISKQLGYVESHHIIPRSFNLVETRIKENQIYLTPREHFICHRLLMKMFVNSRYIKLMTKAVFLMGSNEKYIISSKMYEFIRVEYAKTNKRTEEEKKALRCITSKRKWIKREETNEYMRVDIVDLDKYLIKGFVLGRRLLKGKPMSEARKLQQSILKKGIKYPPEVGIKRGITRKLNNKPYCPSEDQIERLRKMADNRKGQRNSTDHRQKISDSLRKHFDLEIINR